MAGVSVETFLERNKKIAETWTPFQTMTESGRSKLDPPDVVIVTCIDPRCNPMQFAGMAPGEAIVLANICGHIPRVIPDIVAADQLLGFKEIMIVHHTDCGATYFKNSDIMNVVQEWYPNPAALSAVDFGAVSDIEQSVRDDLKALKQSGMVRQELKDNAKGFVLDIKTGLLSPVAGSATTDARI